MSFITSLNHFKVYSINTSVMGFFLFVWILISVPILIVVYTCLLFIWNVCSQSSREPLIQKDASIPDYEAL